jgi:hypothetical protein
VNNGLGFDASWAVPDIGDAFLGPRLARSAVATLATKTRVPWHLPGLAGPPNDPCRCPL